jgi:hypothetical protein
MERLPTGHASGKADVYPPLSSGVGCLSTRLRGPPQASRTYRGRARSRSPARDREPGANALDGAAWAHLRPSGQGRTSGSGIRQ